MFLSSQTNGITYVLNVSTTCQKPPFVQDANFLRIPVIDNYSDKLLPYFQEAFQFLSESFLYNRLLEIDNCSGFFFCLLKLFLVCLQHTVKALA
jgi:hypothetical protein